MDREFRAAIKRLGIEREMLINTPEQYFSKFKESVVRQCTEKLKELRPYKDFLDNILKEAELLKDTHPDIYVFVAAKVENDKKSVFSVEEDLRNAENLSYSEQWESGELRRLDDKIKQVWRLSEFTVAEGD